MTRFADSPSFLPARSARSGRLNCELLEDRVTPGETLFGLAMVALTEFPLFSPGPASAALLGDVPSVETSITPRGPLAGQGQPSAPALESTRDLASALPQFETWASAGSEPLEAVLNSDPEPGTTSTLHTVAWGDDSYIPLLQRAFVGEGRIGNTVTGGGTFELDIGPSTAAPYQMADYPWTQYPEGHAFALIYDADSDYAYLYNNGTVLWYPTEYVGDPARDTLFVRTNATREGSYLIAVYMYLYTPALGDYVAVPFPDGGDGPAYVDAIGPNTRNSLQLLGTTLQDGFVMFFYTYWVWETEEVNRPSQSQLAFQVTAGTWLGE